MHTPVRFSLFLFSLVSAKYYQGRVARTPQNPFSHHHPLHQRLHQLHAGAPRTLQQLHHQGSGIQRKKKSRKSGINSLSHQPNPIIPIHSLFSIGSRRSKATGVATRLIKGRHRKAPQQPPPSPPNFIHLEADKIPGYQTFTLDEYIRAKPDVIHYVDSPVINSKVKEEENEEINSIEGDQLTEINFYDPNSLLPLRDGDLDGPPLHKRSPPPPPSPPPPSTPPPSTPLSSPSSPPGDNTQPAVKLVRYDPANPEELEQYLGGDTEVVARIKSSVERGTAPGSGPYLPIMLGSTMFPLPHIPSMQDSRVRSIVLLVPQDYQL